MYAHSILLACIQEATMRPPPKAKMTFPFDLLVLFSSWHIFHCFQGLLFLTDVLRNLLQKIEYKVSQQVLDQHNKVQLKI